MTTSVESSGHDEDIVAWARAQADHIRHGRFNRLDLVHIAAEIEDVGDNQRRELAVRTAILLKHLLAWERHPTLRNNSLDSTIRAHRQLIARRLAKMPSLATCFTNPDWLEDVWLDARCSATTDGVDDFEAFPDCCPWTMAEILQDKF